MTRAVLPFGVAAIALLAFEVAAQPGPADRSAVIVFVALAAVTSIAGWTLPRWTARSHSLYRTVFVVTLASMATTALAVGVSAGTLMLSLRETAILAVFGLLGLGLGIVLELALARTLALDLHRIRDVARRIGAGDLSARSGLDRLDEVGQAARAIDSMASQLEAARRDHQRVLNARRQFLAAVGHDLRTPLTALQAAVEAIEDGIGPAPAAYSAIHRNLAALRSLVEDLFLLSRIEAGILEFQRVQIDLVELSDEAIEALAPLAQQRNVRLWLQSTSPVVVTGGMAELSRVIRNLVANAIENSPPGGKVSIAVEADAEPTVVVTDEGPGLPDELVDQLLAGFDPTAGSGSKRTGGAGLGLAIARGLVEAHGGRMRAERGPGGRIGFTLPAVPTRDAAGPSA